MKKNEFIDITSYSSVFFKNIKNLQAKSPVRTFY